MVFINFQLLVIIFKFNVNYNTNHVNKQFKTQFEIAAVFSSNGDFNNFQKQFFSESYHGFYATDMINITFFFALKKWFSSYLKKSSQIVKCKNLNQRSIRRWQATT